MALSSSRANGRDGVVVPPDVCLLEAPLRLDAAARGRCRRHCPERGRTPSSATGTPRRQWKRRGTMPSTSRKLWWDNNPDYRELGHTTSDVAGRQGPTERSPPSATPHGPRREATKLQRGPTRTRRHPAYCKATHLKEEMPAHISSARNIRWRMKAELARLAIVRGAVPILQHVGDEA